MGCGFVVTCLRVFLGGLDVLGGLKLGDLAGGSSLGIFGGSNVPSVLILDVRQSMESGNDCKYSSCWPACSFSGRDMLAFCDHSIGVKDS